MPDDQISRDYETPTAEEFIAGRKQALVGRRFRMKDVGQAGQFIWECKAVTFWPQSNHPKKVAILMRPDSSMSSRGSTETVVPSWEPSSTGSVTTPWPGTGAGGGASTPSCCPPKTSSRFSTKPAKRARCSSATGGATRPRPVAARRTATRPPPRKGRDRGRGSVGQRRAGSPRRVADARLRLNVRGRAAGPLLPCRPLLSYAWKETVGQMSTLPVSISYGFETCGLIGRNTFPAASAASRSAALLIGVKNGDIA
jgi:hypothetical protein